VFGLRRVLSETVGGLPRAYWYLWTGNLINRLGGFVTVFLAFYLIAARHFSVAFTGLVVSLVGGGGAAAVLLGGVLADRWGRRPTLLAGQLGTAVTLMGLGLSSGRMAVASWAFAYGIASNVVRPAFSAMMTDLVPPADRVRAFSLNYWAINLGFAFSASIAGLVASVSYVLLFAIDAATTLAAAAIVFIRVAETRPQLPRAEPGVRVEGLGVALRDRVYVSFLGLNALLALIFMQHLSSLPATMHGDGLSPSTYGFIIALNGVLIVALQLPITRFLKDRRRSRVLALATLVIGLGFGLTAVAHVAWVYAVTVVVWTAGEMLHAPVASAVVADLSPAHLRGRYQALYSLSFGLAAFVGPVVGGLVIQRYGEVALWAGCFVVGLMAAAGQLMIAPARRRRLQQLGVTLRVAGGYPPT